MNKLSEKSVFDEFYFDFVSYLIPGLLFNVTLYEMIINSEKLKAANVNLTLLDIVKQFKNIVHQLGNLELFEIILILLISYIGGIFLSSFSSFFFDRWMVPGKRFLKISFMGDFSKKKNT